MATFGYVACESLLYLLNNCCLNGDRGSDYNEVATHRTICMYTKEEYAEIIEAVRDLHIGACFVADKIIIQQNSVGGVKLKFYCSHFRRFGVVLTLLNFFGTKFFNKYGHDSVLVSEDAVSFMCLLRNKSNEACDVPYVKVYAVDDKMIFEIPNFRWHMTHDVGAIWIKLAQSYNFVIDDCKRSFVDRLHDVSIICIDDACEYI